jgi:hypothetical protein
MVSFDTLSIDRSMHSEGRWHGIATLIKPAEPCRLGPPLASQRMSDDLMINNANWCSVAWGTLFPGLAARLSGAVVLGRCTRNRKRLRFRLAKITEFCSLLPSAAGMLSNIDLVRSGLGPYVEEPFWRKSS